MGSGSCCGFCLYIVLFSDTVCKLCVCVRARACERERDLAVTQIVHKRHSCKQKWCASIWMHCDVDCVMSLFKLHHCGGGGGGDDDANDGMSQRGRPNRQKCRSGR